MKKRTSIIVSLALGLLTLSGCASYHPQLAEVPLIAHKGDTRASVSLRGAGFGATITTGITNHLALQVNGYFHDFDHLYSHTALGFYSGSGHFAWESYLGLGYGCGHNKDSDHSFSNQGSFILPFAQLNIGWRNLTKAHIDCGLALKFGRYFPKFSGYVRDYDPDTHTMQESPWSYSTPSTLLEPQIFFRIGSERVKYNLQIGYCWLDNMRKETHTYYWPCAISMGVTFSL